MEYQRKFSYFICYALCLFVMAIGRANSQEYIPEGETMEETECAREGCEVDFKREEIDGEELKKIINEEIAKRKPGNNAGEE